jgi:acylphosphatase
MTEIECTITGIVQGVAYRAFVQDAATELGLTGFVENRTDGSVRVVAQGLPDELKTFIEYLNEGSLTAKVAGVAVDWKTARTRYDEFSVRHG